LFTSIVNIANDKHQSNLPTEHKHSTSSWE